MVALPVTTAAQQRLVTELLAWGEARPPAGWELVEQLRGRLERELAERRPGVDELAAGRPGRQLVVTRTLLERTVCDGLQLEPEPFRHTRDNVRAYLAVAAIERDWERQRRDQPEAVVAQVWDEEASRRPGDPSSRSAWLNACDDRAALLEEVAGLVSVTREVWPPFPPGSVRLHLRQPCRSELAGGRVALRGTPDLVLDSASPDDRARALVVDLRTGLPRPGADRRAVRFDALLVALVAGRAPFRWASYHLTDGRAEYEDLAAAPLHAVVDRVMEAIDQQLRLRSLLPGVGDEALLLEGGAWCQGCRRRAGCPLAAV